MKFFSSSRVFRWCLPGIALFAFAFHGSAAGRIRLELEAARQVDGKPFAITDNGATLAMASAVKALWNVHVPEAGEYRVSVAASGTKAPDGLPKFEVSVGDKVVGAVTLEQENWKIYGVNVKLTKGKQTIGIAFVNDAFKAGEYDRNFFLHSAILIPSSK